MEKEPSFEALTDTALRKPNLTKGGWTHEAHLLVALWHLHNHAVDEATCLLRARIISYNVAVGTENSSASGYHETMTLFWI